MRTEEEHCSEGGEDCAVGGRLAVTGLTEEQCEAARFPAEEAA